MGGVNKVALVRREKGRERHVHRAQRGMRGNTRREERTAIAMGVKERKEKRLRLQLHIK